MARAKTCLILGAGASRGYGFPVGAGLRQKILKINSDEMGDILGFGRQSLQSFVGEFRDAQSYSIDAFLGRRIEFAEPGKAAIAYVLLQAERASNVTDESHDDHWYQYLLNQLTADDWDDFDPSWLSVVTFNYDRSLEHFLVLGIAATYGKRIEQVLDKLEPMRIVHAYGWLGDPWIKGPDHVPFKAISENQLSDMVAKAARQLVIIPEGRSDGPSLIESRHLIRSSDRICFLGFGFDTTNVQRLGAPHTFIWSGQPKRTAATSIGLTVAETSRAALVVFDQQFTAPFNTMNCIGLLRHTLILDQ